MRYIVLLFLFSISLPATAVPELPGTLLPTGNEYLLEVTLPQPYYHIVLVDFNITINNEIAISSLKTLITVPLAIIVVTADTDNYHIVTTILKGNDGSAISVDYVVMMVFGALPVLATAYLLTKRPQSQF